MHSLERLDAYLRSLEKRFRIDAASRGTALVAMAALLATLAAVLLANSFAFSERSVLAARLLLFFALAFALVFALVMPLLRINRRKAAHDAEKRFPEFEERLLTFAESGDRCPFLELLAADTVEVAEYAKPESVVPGARITAFASAGAIAAGALVWLILAGPGFLGYGASLLWAGPPREGAQPFYEITVSPGNRMVRRGSDQTIAAQLTGFQSSRARLLLKYHGASKWEDAPMQPQTGGFQFLLAGLAESAEYYVQAGRVRSQTYTLTVVDLPAVKKLRVTYHYPGWTGLKNVVEDPGGDLRAVAGSEADVAVLTDKPLAGGILALEDGTRLPLAASDNGWLSARVRIEKDGLYHIAAVEQGQDVRLTEDFFIEAQKETPPVVRIVQPNRDARVNPIEEVTVTVEAEDDFALDNVTLMYSVNGGPEKSVPLLAHKGVKKASGSATIALEDFKLVPGDMVAVHASARDARSTSNTDMMFIEAQPFEREYSQSQQAGGGGEGQGGGEREDNRISDRQKEIIAATWNEVRDRGKDKATAAENARFLTDVQTKLRDQATSLANRMKAREIAGASQEFSSFSKDMEGAAQDMAESAGKLKTQAWKDALGPEQRALQHLLRAEATFRQIQVAFGSRGQRGGAGGGARGLGRDLENLFDLELDTEKNQYETEQRASSSGQQRQKEIDEAMQKLEQLARRQQELAQQQRQNRQSFQQRWQQEMLRREAEELQRQMEQLARGDQQQGQQGQQSQQGAQGQQSASGQQSSAQQRMRAMAGARGQRQQDQVDPRLRQALERLSQATGDMRRATTPEGAQSEAEARRASERLQEASRMMRGLRSQESSEQLSGLGQRADQLTEQQKDFANRMRQAYQPQAGQQPSQAMQQAQQFSKEQQQLMEQLRALEREMQDASRAMAGSNRAAASKLRDALSQIQQNETAMKMRLNSEYIRRGMGAYIWPRQAPITSDLEAMRELVKQAQASAGKQGEKTDGVEQALAQVERLRDQIAQMRSGQRQTRQQQGQQQGGQQGQQPGQQQQGQQQGGQQQASGRTGSPNGGQRQQAGGGDRWGERSTVNRGDLLPPGDRPVRPATPEEMERAYRDGLRDLGALREWASGSPEIRRDLDALTGEMRGLDPRRFQGNPELLEQLNARLLTGLEQIELALRRKLDEKNGEARAATQEAPPAGYADSVAEYFRKLSKSR